MASVFACVGMSHKEAQKAQKNSAKSFVLLCASLWLITLLASGWLRVAL